MEWGMTPQTINAYYNPSTNEICFPAAILQPPFFDPNADDAVNYGAIGGVIGHEMSHGFDDQGASSTSTAISTTGGRLRTRRISMRAQRCSPTTSPTLRFCRGENQR